jgi:hypothetical protein
MPRSPIRLAFSCLIPVGIFLLSAQPASSGPIDVAALVASCAGHRNGARLLADNNVLCFDGPITHQTSLDPFRQLNRGGTLVVRSPGGLNVLAMHMADILLEKNARVVIHDYCLSACANALFVATHETHVAEGAIVAWHGNSGCHPVSETLKETASERAKQKIARYEELCREPKVAHDFYRKRGISDDFTRQPQTPYSRKMFQAMHREAFDKRRIFWTWHPDNFGSSFKSKIVFRSFPDEDTVQAWMGHSGARVVYDRPASRRRSGPIAGTAGPPPANLASS